MLDLLGRVPEYTTGTLGHEAGMLDHIARASEPEARDTANIRGLEAKVNKHEVSAPARVVGMYKGNDEEIRELASEIDWAMRYFDEF